MQPSFIRKLLRLWRRHIHCNHMFLKYVDTTDCYKCKRKVRLTDNEYLTKKLKIEERKDRWNSY